MTEFFLFFAVGFVAQIIDGALGMAYGVISATMLISSGVAPAHVSAAVHASKLFTTAGSAAAHRYHGNVDWRLFARLAPFGVAGGVIGALVLTSIDGAVMRPVVTVYLACVGAWLLLRSFRPIPTRPVSGRLVAPLGAAGGFLDAIGGGGWGPIVTTGLIGAGAPPRFAIGTVNTAEFVVTVAVIAAFAVTLATGYWDSGEGFAALAPAVSGLILGGLLAAPLGAMFVRYIREIVLLRAVGTLILTLAAWQTWRALS